jgi:SAM-dependent methyltransferase
VEPTDHNRRAFDEAHRTSENVLQAPGMPEAIRERLHGAAGHRVLHLLCGTGRESADLAALGALVTGVDDDEAALEAARRRVPDLPWVHADVHALPPELLLGRWDLVYLGYGSLRRLRAAEPFAGGVAAALRPGGVLLLHDVHPAAACLDAFGRWRDDYFAAVTPGELVGAVAAAGLALRGLEEWPGKDAKLPGHLVLAAEKPA